MNTPFPDPLAPRQAAPDNADRLGVGAGNGPAAGFSQCPAAGPDQQFVPVAAMEAILALRHDQIFKWGHTLEADAARPLLDFALGLKSLAAAIAEDVQFHKETSQLERRTIKLGALAMAFFDRLQAERGE